MTDVLGSKDDGSLQDILACVLDAPKTWGQGKTDDATARNVGFLEKLLNSISDVLPETTGLTADWALRLQMRLDLPFSGMKQLFMAMRCAHVLCPAKLYDEMIALRDRLLAEMDIPIYVDHKRNAVHISLVDVCNYITQRMELPNGPTMVPRALAIEANPKLEQLFPEALYPEVIPSIVFVGDVDGTGAGRKAVEVFSGKFLELSNFNSLFACLPLGLQVGASENRESMEVMLGCLNPHNAGEAIATALNTKFRYAAGDMDVGLICCFAPDGKALSLMLGLCSSAATQGNMWTFQRRALRNEENSLSEPVVVRTRKEQVDLGEKRRATWPKAVTDEAIRKKVPKYEEEMKKKGAIEEEVMARARVAYEKLVSDWAIKNNKSTRDCPVLLFLEWVNYIPDILHAGLDMIGPWFDMLREWGMDEAVSTDSRRVSIRYYLHEVGLGFQAKRMFAPKDEYGKEIRRQLNGPDCHKLRTSAAYVLRSVARAEASNPSQLKERSETFEAERAALVQRLDDLDEERGQLERNINDGYVSSCQQSIVVS